MKCLYPTRFPLEPTEWPREESNLRPQIRSPHGYWLICRDFAGDSKSRATSRGSPGSSWGADTLTGVEPKLTPDQILGLISATPEQAVFDWKGDFNVADPDARGEVVKDIVAVANGTAFAHTNGYIVYGVNPRDAKRPVVGVKTQWDDATLQQFMASKVDPKVVFLHYHVEFTDGAVVAVTHVPRARSPFHVVQQEVGNLRQGQAFIRDGSSTRPVMQADWKHLLYGPKNGYLPQVLAQHGMLVKEQEVRVATMRELRAQEDKIRRDMDAIAGVSLYSGL